MLLLHDYPNQMMFKQNFMNPFPENLQLKNKFTIIFYLISIIYIFFVISKTKENPYLLKLHKFKE